MPTPAATQAFLLVKVITENPASFSELTCYLLFSSVVGARPTKLSEQINREKILHYRCKFSLFRRILRLVRKDTTIGRLTGFAKVQRVQNSYLQ
jgi:hypothetical protein